MRRIHGAMLFRDRIDAGSALASKLVKYAAQRSVLVFGLPRGGVPVAARVAESLGAPLGVLLVRKLGVPGHEEYAMGAIASGGVVELDETVVRELRLSPAAVRAVVVRESEELARRERVYQRGRPFPDVRGRTVILVDDGLATGSTMRAAVSAVRQHAPAFVVVAVPVASCEACADLSELADECVCLSRPEPFSAVGAWYEDFTPTTDDEVLACLDRPLAGKDAEAARVGEGQRGGSSPP
jgi:putative phosphoribosyl transferase